MKRFPLSIDVLGPLLSRGLEPGAFGIDAVAARDAEGHIYLAGSHILGKVRDALHTLAACRRGWIPQTWEADWFGGAGDEISGQNRARVFLSDLKPSHEPSYDPKNPRTRSRVAINPLTGAALDRALLIMEHAYRTGEQTRFSGTLTVLGSEADDIQIAFLRALSWITNVGGLRTIGHGRVVGACFDTPPEQKKPAAPPAADRFAFGLTFENPFCIATQRVADNAYEGGDVVPGGALKGALAFQLARDGGFALKELETATGPFPTLRRHFARVRFTHAFPRPNGGTVIDRPRVAPFSLAFCDGIAAPRDLALVQNPDLVGGKAPAFAPDYKDVAKAKVKEQWDWPDVPRDLRIRTAMDPRLRAGKPQALFAIEARAVHAHEWLGVVDLDGVPAADRQAVANELCAALANGLAGIGRTQAFARTWFCPVPAVKPIDPRKEHVVVLQAPALLRWPELPGDAGEAPSERLKTAYDETFRALSGGALTLTRLFVRERLSGAAFMAERFFHGREYRPFLMTEAGSTFVFKPNTNDAAGILHRWATGGLPLPAGIADAYGIALPSDYDASAVGPDESGAWQQCPYLRQNGYGEVVVDDPRHSQLTPSVSERAPVVAETVY